MDLPAAQNIRSSCAVHDSIEVNNLKFSYVYGLDDGQATHFALTPPTLYVFFKHSYTHIHVLETGHGVTMQAGRSR